jgi:hypothetical protein
MLCSALLLLIHLLLLEFNVQQPFLKVRTVSLKYIA